VIAATRFGMLAAAGAVILAGCASVPRDAGFPEVQNLLAMRIDQRVEWDRDARQDDATHNAVRALLQHPLTADMAVQIALLNNRSLQASYERLGIGQADLVQAGLLHNPTLSIQVLRSSIGTETDAGVVQDLLGILTRTARKRIASAEFDRIELGVAETALELAARTRIAFYTAVADGQILELRQTAASAAQIAAELAERQQAAGTLSRRDQTLHQAFYARALLQEAEFETRANSDREAINRLLGLWGPDTQWTLPHRLPDIPAAPPALEHLESVAVAQRMDLAAARADVDSAAYVLAQARRYRFLSVLGIGFGIKRAADGQISRGPSLELGLPLFDRGQARIIGLESQLRLSEQRMSGMATDIRSQVREARVRLLAAQESANYFRTVLLPLQEQALAETQRYYNGMLAGTYELLAAKQGNIDTARDYIDAVRDYWIARAELGRALGGRIPPEPAPQPGPMSQSSGPQTPAPEHEHREGGK